MSLATKSSSVAQTTQYWYLTESQGGYIIENVANHKKLSVSTQDGALTCTLSDEEQVWTFMDYHVPTEVSTISSKVNSDYYLKNYQGRNYNDERIIVGNDARHTEQETNEDKYGDKCGFRIESDTDNTYRIMPISSGNGKHRAIAISDNSNKVVLLNNTDHPDTQAIEVIDTSRLLLVIELQSDGYYVIKLNSNKTRVLTYNGNGQDVTFDTISTSSVVPDSQKWAFGIYQYYLIDGTTVSYTEVENYYSAYGFTSPFGPASQYPLTMTSDFGPRKPSGGTTYHTALDLRTGIANRNLYSPIGGRVIAARTDCKEGELGEGELAKAGNYVVIETNITAFGNPNYKVCIVYMHLHSADMSKVGEYVSTSDCLGTTGWTGLSSMNSSHLHYGVFLRSSSMDETSWSSYPLNPLMFFTPASYANTKPSEE